MPMFEEPKEGEALKPIGNGQFQDALGNIFNEKGELIKKALDPELKKQIGIIKSLYPDEPPSYQLELARIVLNRERAEKKIEEKLEKRKPKPH